MAFGFGFVSGSDNHFALLPRGWGHGGGWVSGWVAKRVSQLRITYSGMGQRSDQEWKGENNILMFGGAVVLSRIMARPMSVTNVVNISHRRNRLRDENKKMPAAFMKYACSTDPTRNYYQWM